MRAGDIAEILRLHDDQGIKRRCRHHRAPAPAMTRGDGFDGLGHRIGRRHRNSPEQITKPA
jgi:hypothetical protein